MKKDGDWEQNRDGKWKETDRKLKRDRDKAGYTIVEDTTTEYYRTLYPQTKI